MAYVIVGHCKDASCIPVCPVDCIRPAQTTDGFDDALQCSISTPTHVSTAEHVSTSARSTPSATTKTAAAAAVQRINADHFDRHPLVPDYTRAGAASSSRPRCTPSGDRRCRAHATCSCGKNYIDIDGVEVEVFERLPTPFDLIRAGLRPTINTPSR